MFCLAVWNRRALVGLMRSQRFIRSVTGAADDELLCQETFMSNRMSTYVKDGGFSEADGFYLCLLLFRDFTMRVWQLNFFHLIPLKFVHRLILDCAQIFNISDECQPTNLTVMVHSVIWGIISKGPFSSILSCQRADSFNFNDLLIWYFGI